VNRLDNPSEFLAPREVEVRRDGRDHVIEVHGAIAIASTIAYLRRWSTSVNLVAYGHDVTARTAMLSRRQFTHVVSAGLAGAVSPALPAVTAALATVARPSDVRFAVMRGRSKIGVHTVAFRDRPDGLAVHTVIDLAVKVVFITVFRYQHECQDVWVSGQLRSLRSRTIEDGKRYAVEATAEPGGIRVVGPGGPLVVGARLLTSNSLWNPLLVDQQRLIDAQHGGEIGLVVHRRGTESLVLAGRERVVTDRFQILTPHFGGLLWYDATGRWVKGSLEIRGEWIDYVVDV